MTGLTSSSVSSSPARVRSGQAVRVQGQVPDQPSSGFARPARQTRPSSRRRRQDVVGQAPSSLSDLSPFAAVCRQAAVDVVQTGRQAVDQVRSSPSEPRRPVQLCCQPAVVVVNPFARRNQLCFACARLAGPGQARSGRSSSSGAQVLNQAPRNSFAPAPARPVPVSPVPGFASQQLCWVRVRAGYQAAQTSALPYSGSGQRPGARVVRLTSRLCQAGWTVSLPCPAQVGPVVGRVQAVRSANSQLFLPTSQASQSIVQTIIRLGPCQACQGSGSGFVKFCRLALSGFGQVRSLSDFCRHLVVRVLSSCPCQLCS